jgi:hypothetical protein
VASLADDLAMRSAFAARFTELFDEPAMQYVARWRMHPAVSALNEGATVGVLANRIGYRSEAAFSRVQGHRLDPRGRSGAAATADRSICGTPRARPGWTSLERAESL